uniref:DDE Tnp4 domain-containing protein n=1 Tax=Spongospora subterranea TaxID=70186 RepID=A0A0H5RCB0_9EUKA|eukprot:CRZ11673.1 hypothetical protein [Spongospora subterranea]
MLELIHFDDRWNNWQNLVPSCYVDGVDFQVFERSTWTKNDFSHKFGHAGLRYEIATALGCSKIVHIAGGVPCGLWPDLKLARHCLVPRMIPGEKACADKGYRDGHERFLTSFPRAEATPLQRQINSEIHLIGARHESINARMKNFGCLSARFFRHGREFHPVCFTACANLVQLLMKTKPLFELLPALKKKREAQRKHGD